MTKISYIHGIPADEWADRGKQIPAQPYLNYSALTAGEMKLALLREQLDILTAFYPEEKEFQKGAAMIDRALYKGIHGSAPSWSILTPQLERVAAAIARARKNRRPANGWGIVGREQNSVGGVNNALVPMEDCNAIVNDPYLIPGSVAAEQAAERYRLCMEDNKYRPMLNQHLEKSSHHLLYEFVTSQQANAYPGTVTVKSVLHKSGASTFSRVTKLDRDNIKLWMRNGVMRNNAKNGLEPLQPEASIALLRDDPRNATAGISGIGEPLTVAATVVLVIKLLGAIAAAATAAAMLVDSMKKAAPQNYNAFQEVTGIGSGGFGPESEDWLGYQRQQNGATATQEEESELSKLAIPLALGAGVLLLTN
jgi:hypothetical protein